MIKSSTAHPSSSLLSTWLLPSLIFFWAGTIHANTCQSVFQASSALYHITAKTPDAEVYSELARMSKLSISEVEAIHKNFAEERVTDGSTGVFRIGSNLVLDTSVNLIAAYRDIRKHLSSGKELRVSDIERIRALSMQYLSSQGGKELITSPAAYRKLGSVAHIEGTVRDEVLESLTRYGYTVTQNGERTTIRYSESANFKANMESYVQQLNAMIKLRYPPELIATFASQELLIIHPFANGNGRTARLLGQALYKHLTGQDIIFPREFHSEMNHSRTQLAYSIIAPGHLDRTGKLNKKNIHSLSYSVMSNPVVWKTSGEAGKIQDSPFYPEFTAGYQSYKYAEIPADLRRVEKPVYFGKAFESADEANKFIDVVFRFGRSTRGTPHRDIVKHQASTTGRIPSGYFQTTLKYDSATGFASLGFAQKSVILHIDPRNADVLDVANFGERLSIPNHKTFLHEYEVVFSSTLNPRRIIAAEVIDLNGNRVIYMNPNYRDPTK